MSLTARSHSVLNRTESWQPGTDQNLEDTSINHEGHLKAPNSTHPNRDFRTVNDLSDQIATWWPQLKYNRNIRNLVPTWTDSVWPWLQHLISTNFKHFTAPGTGISSHTGSRSLGCRSSAACFANGSIKIEKSSCPTQSSIRHHYSVHLGMVSQLL